MSLTDDDLGRRLRAADPARTPHDAPLTASHLALRDRITTTGRAPAETTPTPHRGRWPLFALPAAAAMIVALFLAWTLLPSNTPPAAAALTPDPLVYTSTPSTLEEVVRMSQEKLAAGTSPATTAERGASWTGWYLHIDNADVATSALIRPQDVICVWNADGSGTITTLAGTPYWAEDNTVALDTREAPEPGSVISTLPFDAAQAPAADPQGDTPADMRTLLTSFGLPDGASGGDVIENTRAALSWWNLTDAQHGALLSLLIETEDATVLGTTTDRAGRPVIGIAGTPSADAQTRHILLVSTQTGRIVGVETTRTEALPPIPAGAVVSYTLWGTDE
ncbi:hypothetical protein AB0N73_02810 [Microbacterium sp. NPDC089189]|uniref:hypothetical protein n=1 Tax=Microbacterium sp. NPDC089189 TaxID=3154972 RepID=UPI003416156D